MYPQPYQQYYQPVAYVAPKPPNGLGTASMVLGIVGVAFAVWPITYFVGLPLLLVGTPLGAVGLRRVLRKEATNIGVSTTGLALGAIGLVLCALWFFFWVAAVASA